MMYYRVSEHFGRRIRKQLVVVAEHPNDAVLFAAGPPFLVPQGADGYNYIDDELGGGALVDPDDPEHVLRADPIYIDTENAGGERDGEDYSAT